VLNSRHLVYEAQQAHYYGLNPALALASVTSTPATALGVGWRVGTLAAGAYTYLIFIPSEHADSFLGPGYDAGQAIQTFTTIDLIPIILSQISSSGTRTPSPSA
jgi:hypothetical protein